MATADLVQGLAGNQAPSRIGRFALGPELGRGRMGAVYQATDSQSKNKVAMRIVHLYRFSAEPDVARLRLRNTAKAASGLNSPNIVSLIGGGELQELFYLTLEFIPGTTLRQRLLNREKFSISEFLDIARQLCAGLEHAHARKIYHGNLVPWNLIFEDDGTLKIMDFGLAHSLVASAAREDFAYVPYLSPELLRGQPLDGRADLFSAACILYEILAGKKAFSGSSREQVAQNILDGFTPPAHESSIMIHPGLSAVLAKALARDPDDRYQRAADLIRELEGFQSLGTRLSPAKPEAAPPAVPTPRPFPTPKPAPVSAYGVPDKPLIAPRPMEAPAVKPPEPPPVPPSPWTPEPAVAVKPVAAPSENRPPAPPPPASPAAAPGQKAAMVLTGCAAVLLIVALIALWYTGGHKVAPEKVVTPEPATTAVQNAPSPTPVSTSPAAPRVMEHRTKSRTTAAPVAAAPPAPATGDLMITAEPAGTLVQVDDGAPAPGPLSKSGIPAGTHTVIFSKPGYVTESRKIDVTAGGKALVAITLQARGAFVTVASQPAGATVMVDGKDSGLTPAKLVLVAGQHTITVLKQGYLPQSAMPTLARGQQFQYSPELLAAGSTAEIKTVGKFKRMFGGSGEQMGMVDVKSDPKGATVMVNGHAVSKRTPVTFMLNPGNYQIEIRMDGYRAAKRVISLDKGGQTRVEEQLMKE